MGITTEQFDKIKNLDKLTREDKKALLEDTWRAGFNPALHQCRAIFDLTDEIEKLNKSTRKYSCILIWLTAIMTVAVIVQIILFFVKK